MKLVQSLLLTVSLLSFACSHQSSTTVNVPQADTASGENNGQVDQDGTELSFHPTYSDHDEKQAVPQNLSAPVDHNHGSLSPKKNDDSINRANTDLSNIGQ